MANASEKAVRDFAEVHGYTVLRKGWPDFLCFIERDGKIELHAIEVKSKNGQLHGDQEKMLDLLSTVMPVYFIRDMGVEEPLRVVDWRKRLSPEVQNA